MRAVAVIVAVILVLSLFGVMVNGINDAQTTERVDAFAGVTTGVVENDADVVLVADPWGDSILGIISIVSDNALDAPLPDSYVTATKTLTVRGLAASDTRGLTVTYDYGSLQDHAANIGTFLGMTPLFITIALISLVVCAGIGGAMVVLNKRRGY